jgi:hypothetical protein
LFIETVRDPPSAVRAILYTPVRTPELVISQCEPSVQSKVVKVVAICLTQVALTALVLKPVPEIVPLSPRLPLAGVSVKADWTTNCSLNLSPNVPVALTLWIPPIAVVLTVKLHDPIIPLETVQTSDVPQNGPPPSGFTVALSVKVTLVSDGFQFAPVIVTEVPAVPVAAENAAHADVGLPVRVNEPKAVGFEAEESLALIM